MVQPKISVEDLLPRLNAHLNQINFKMFAKIVSDSNNFLWIGIFLLLSLIFPFYPNIN